MQAKTGGKSEKGGPQASEFSGYRTLPGYRTQNLTRLYPGPVAVHVRSHYDGRTTHFMIVTTFLKSLSLHKWLFQTKTSRQSIMMASIHMLMLMHLVKKCWT